LANATPLARSIFRRYGRQRRVWRPAARLLVVASVVLGAGCSSNQEPAACLPEEAKPAEAAVTAPRIPSAPTTVDIYLDASGSMRGFIPQQDASGSVKGAVPHPDKSDNLTFRSLMSDLYGYRSGSGNKLYAFGTCVVEITKMFQTDQTLTRGFYQSSAWPQKQLPPDCVKGYPSIKAPTSFIEMSRLDLALEKISQDYVPAPESAPSNKLTIVVTDLFLTSDGKTDEIANALKPAVEILKGGAAIGVLGIQVPFKGRPDVSRLVEHPTGKPNVVEWHKQDVWKTDHDGLLAVYLLVVGDPLHVEHLIAHLKDRALKKEVLANGLSGSGRLHYHLFTRNRFGPASALQADGAAKTPMVQMAEKVRSFDLQPTKDWIAEAEIPQYAGTWPVRLLATSNETWFFYPKGPTCAANWTKVNSQIAVKPEKNKVRLVLGRENLQQLASRFVYLTKIAVEVIDDPQPDHPSWLSKWTMSDTEAAQYAEKKVPFVPTLNLHTILRELERAALGKAGDSTSKRNVAVFHFAYRRE
jgi:hypothetical protein